MSTATAEQRAALEAFDGALAREAHNLSRWPALLWQQLHNRLQWEEQVHGILEPERRRRSSPGCPPWMRTRTPYPESGGLIRTLKAHTGVSSVPVTGRVSTGGFTGCAVAPDGSFLVSTSWDSTGLDNAVRLWNPFTGQEQQVLAGHTGVVSGCAVAPDGAYVVSVGEDTTVRLWDPLTGQTLRVLEGHTGAVNGCAVAPEGAYVVSASSDNTLKLWDPVTGEVLRTLTGHTPAAWACVAVSPDGRWIVSGSRDGTLEVWDAESGAELRTFEGHTAEVTGCAVAPEGAYVVSASTDGTLKLWDPFGGELKTLRGNMTGGLTGCAVAPDGSFLVSTGWDKTVRLWDPSTGRERRTLEGHAGMVSGCAVAPDGSYAVSAGDDWTLKLWDPTTVADRPALDGPPTSVTACAVSPDGSYVVSGGDDATLQVRDPASGEEWGTLRGHRGRVVDCAVAPDGAFLVSASDDDTVKVWALGRSADVDATLVEFNVVAVWTGEVLRTLDHPWVSSCAVAPDGSYVVSAGLDGAIRLWDPATGELLQTLPGSKCAVAPGGSYVVVAKDQLVNLWDPFTGQELKTMEGHIEGVNSCAVTPDGAFVVVASGDKTLKLWDPLTGKESGTLEGHTAAVYACAVTPDGAYVVSAGGDMALKLWDLSAREEATTLLLPGELHLVALHPILPRVLCGDRGGHLYRIDLMCVEYGPIVVTATDFGEGYVVHCPHCNVFHTFDRECSACPEPHDLDDWLGEDKDCPNASCEGPLKVNAFTVPPRAEAPPEEGTDDVGVPEPSAEEADLLRRIAAESGYAPDAVDPLLRHVKRHEWQALTWLADQVEAGHGDDLDLNEFAAQVFGSEAMPSAFARLHDLLGGPHDEPVRLAAGRLIYYPSTLGDSVLAAARPALRGALARGLRSGGLRVRAACVWAVFKLGRGDAYEVIARVLPESDEDARFEIVRILGFMGDRRATPVLLEALGREPTARNRSAILWALGTLADPAALEPCIGALGDRDAEARGYAAWALGKLQDPAALPALREALSDRDPDVRRWVEEATGVLEASFPTR